MYLTPDEVSRLNLLNQEILKRKLTKTKEEISNRKNPSEMTEQELEDEIKSFPNDGKKLKV